MPLIVPEMEPTAGLVTVSWVPTEMLPAATKEVPEPTPPEVNVVACVDVNLAAPLLMLIAAPDAPVFSPLMVMFAAVKAAELLISTPLPRVLAFLPLKTICPPSVAVMVRSIGLLARFGSLTRTLSAI